MLESTWEHTNLQLHQALVSATLLRQLLAGKDPVAHNFLGRDVLFGNDALKNKLACNLYRPMAAGVAQDDEANLAAAKAFVSHLLETVDPEEFDEVFGVICSPSHVSFTDKSNLLQPSRGQVNAIMVVTEPFATAFGIGEIASSIVVDIGAGTTDIARIYGTFPTDEDQVTIQEAGDWLDNELMELIRRNTLALKSRKTWFANGKRKSPMLVETTVKQWSNFLLKERNRLSISATLSTKLVK